MIATAQQSNETLAIHLLGTLAITRGGRARPLPASRKTRALVAYLALAAAPCRRVDLCDLLWDDVADPRSELRWSLSKIREALGPWLLSTQNSVSIAREGLDVDAVAFRHLADGPITACAVSDALALWRGEPLADADVPDCYRYHLWWLSECEAFATLQGQFLHAAVEQAWSTPREALVAARRLVAQRPLDELGHVRVAQAMERTGRHADADAYRDATRRSLSAELGVSKTEILTEAKSLTAPAPTMSAVAAHRRSVAPPLVHLERLDVHPPDHALAAIAAAVSAGLAQGLWRGKVCEVSGGSQQRQESAQAASPAARFVVRGSVIKLDDGLRLVLRCAETRQDTVLWCAQFRPCRASDLTGWIDRAVSAIEVAIRHAEMTHDPDGEFGARARIVEMLSLAGALEPSANRTALHAAETILQENADDATALAVAAWCLAQRAVYNWSLDGDADRGKSRCLATAATMVGSEDPTCLTIIGAARTLVGDRNGAGALLDRALRLNPRAASAYSRKGWLANYSDQPDLAIRCFRTALQLAPIDRTDFNNLVGLGVAHFIRGDYEPAVRRMEQGLAINPKATWVQRNLIPAYASAGRTADAARGLCVLLEEHGSLSVAAVENAMVFSRPVMARIAQGLAEAGLRWA